jgi:hypothetical protein
VSLRDPNIVNPKRRKRVAIVIANPAISTTSGWPGGFWWSELTHTYYVFTEQGYDAEVFSPNGSKCEADVDAVRTGVARGTRCRLARRLVELSSTTTASESSCVASLSSGSAFLARR